MTDRWRNNAHPKYRRIVSDWTARNLSEMSIEQLMDGVEALVAAATEYYTAVQTIIPRGGQQRGAVHPVL